MIDGLIMDDVINMFHRCVKCGKIYERASEEILVGCSCGSKLFYFVKPQSASKKKDPEEVECFYELEDDAGGLTVFDIESINVISNGKYELNIDGLMNQGDSNGLIYKYGDGKYGIDLNAGMQSSLGLPARKKKGKHINMRS